MHKPHSGKFRVKIRRDIQHSCYTKLSCKPTQIIVPIIEYQYTMLQADSNNNSKQR